MDALTTSLLVAGAVFLSSLVGLLLHRVVPEGHLSQETRSVILARLAPGQRLPRTRRAAIACLNVAHGATMPKIIEKGTPMSQVMIVVEFETKPEHRSQFIDLMRGHAERSRRDDGCLQFDLMLPKDDDKHVFLVEKWRDQAALDAHAKGPMPGNTYKDWIVGRKVARGAPAD
jgi:quinol monooxygenase YgiN